MFNKVLVFDHLFAMEAWDRAREGSDKFLTKPQYRIIKTKQD